MRPAIDDVIKILRSEIEAKFNRVYLVVDALNGFPEMDRANLLTTLENIEPEKISLVVTSRAFEDIDHDTTVMCFQCGKHIFNLYFRYRTCLWFDLCQNCSDKFMSWKWKHKLEEFRIMMKEIKIPEDEIRRFVQWDLDQQLRLGSDSIGDARFRSGPIAPMRLGRFCGSFAELRKRIPSAAVSQANGMYHLAKLHMNSLKLQTSPAEVMKALKTLSPEASSSYKNILEPII